MWAQTKNCRSVQPNVRRPVNALEPLLRPVAAMINRQITAKTPARTLCSELDGKTFALQVGAERPGGGKHGDGEARTHAKERG